MPWSATSSSSTRRRRPTLTVRLTDTDGPQGCGPSRASRELELRDGEDRGIHAASITLLAPCSARTQATSPTCTRAWNAPSARPSPSASLSPRAPSISPATISGDGKHASPVSDASRRRQKSIRNPAELDHSIAARHRGPRMHCSSRAVPLGYSRPTSTSRSGRRRRPITIRHLVRMPFDRLSRRSGFHWADANASYSPRRPRWRMARKARRPRASGRSKSPLPPNRIRDYQRLRQQGALCRS